MNETELLKVLVGQNGSLIIKDTTDHAGKWKAIAVITNTVFTLLIENGSNKNVSGVTFPANHVIYGNFTEIKLASGSVVAYE